MEAEHEKKKLQNGESTESVYCGLSVSWSNRLKSRLPLPDAHPICLYLLQSHPHHPILLPWANNLINFFHQSLVPFFRRWRFFLLWWWHYSCFKSLDQLRAAFFLFITHQTHIPLVLCSLQPVSCGLWRCKGQPSRGVRQDCEFCSFISTET